MKFIDEIEITVKSGKGGKGRVSFLHNYANPMAGPDGGNGGNGGALYFVGSSRTTSFYRLSSKSQWFAEDGTDGGDVLKTGKTGADLRIEVPLGTVVYIVNKKTGNEFLGEVLSDGQLLLVAHGGKGGLGNSAFASSVNRAPRYAQHGELTKEFRVYLELKTIADLGFLGLPNSGKSTLLNALTNADVKAENYEFTTLNPQLGVLSETNSKVRTVIADLPGIIEGASENRGLGLRFLRHISRCKVLVFVIDASRPDPISDFHLLENELKKSNQSEFKTKEKVIVWNKMDLLSLRNLNELKANALALDCRNLVFISALRKENLDQITELIETIVAQTKDLVDESNKDKKTYKVYDFTSDLDIQVRKLKNGYWKVFGSYLERIITESRKDKVEALVSKALENPIAKDKLLQSGIKSGDILLIDNKEYFWT